MAKVLYISFDGMTDPLGQSQVIPYLKGLSQNGHLIKVLSCEKKENYLRLHAEVSDIIVKSGIEWISISYTKGLPILSTIWNILKLKITAVKIFQKDPFDIVHCRSYIAALIGMTFKKKSGVRFIFDMRGFWADERLDGGIWNIRNPIYKSVYNYFKKREKRFLKEADYIICLTQKAKKEILGWKLIPAQPIEVIPCCVDTDFFSFKNIDPHVQKRIRQRLGFLTTDFIITYLGAIGTWYMACEMLDFFKCLLATKPNAKFFFITNEKKETINNIAEEKGIDLEKIIVISAKREEVPLFLSLCDLAIFFIKPAFSKIASSPTKLGELMSMGIPVICNKGIGDIDSIIERSNAGFLVHSFTEMEYMLTIKEIDKIIQTDKSPIVAAANHYFSLQNGVKIYDRIYRTLC